MRENSNWSLNWGTWGGVRVRAHASLFAVFVVMIFLAEFAGLLADVAGRQRGLQEWLFPWYGVMAWFILLASVVVHEFGHVLAAARTGGSADLVVLGPLGGMHPPHVPREPHREVIVAMAGPLANLFILVLLAPALLLGGVALGDILLHPFTPAGMLSGPSWMVGLKMTFWINWMLLVVNFIPAPPLDAGRAVRSLLWPVMGYRGAIRTVSRCGMLTALVLCLIALWQYEPRDARTIPIWLPLVSLAVYLYFASRQENLRGDADDSEDDLFGYDFSQGYTSLERNPHAVRHPGPLRRWLQQRREQKDRRLRQIEEDEERRFDGILIRIKELGIDSLPPEDRALLQRVSARYRNRMQS